MKKTLAAEVLDDALGSLPQDAAGRLAGYRLNDSLKQRAADLGRRAGEGALSEEERAEYRELIAVNDLLAVLKLAAARRSAAA